METRTIKLIEARFFQLTLQPMNDSADSCRIIAVISSGKIFSRVKIIMLFAKHWD